MKNVILIGMPAVGKSTVGKLLASSLKMDFIDTDDVIRQGCMVPLSEVIEKYGVDNFVKIEEKIISSINVKNTVIATGGSAVYGASAMEHLRKDGVFVYLKISYENIALRLRRMKSRGVAIREGMTLKDLYDERTALYEKYADIIIEEDNNTVEKTVRECLDALKKL